MRTLVISDLHLGSTSGSGLLEKAELRAPLLAAVAKVDRLVLLGDVLELRHGPPREAMSAAQPFFQDLARVLAGRELVLVAGNHDHALIEPWLARRGEAAEPPPLGSEQLLEPVEASPALARIARWAAPARVRVAYPGLWLRADVYATHGHYLDCHLTVPTLERLSMAAMMRLLRRRPASLAGAGDYEAICAPVFAWRDAVARDARTGSALNGLATVRAWSALGGGAGESDLSGAARSARARSNARRSSPSARPALRSRALPWAFALAVAALNRAGLGPFHTDISTDELRRAGLRAMGAVADGLGAGDAWVIFGHTHRTGPLAADDASEWRGSGGARLVNCGSWTYASIFLTDTPGESPYWPGGSVLVEEQGAPVLGRLLQDYTREQIRPPRPPQARRARSTPRSRHAWRKARGEDTHAASGS